ncbi:MAG: TolC family outer membrane protein [Gammaproteobacteria bacterium]|nr:TolC family outer membrane protein [Gammaproteobacteria bacterium]
MYSRSAKRWACALVTAASAAVTQAQDVQIPLEISGLREAITQGVMISPRVNASWYTFEASREAERGARGGYLPSVDVYAEYGEEERKTPLVDFGDYTRDATRFSITQMLFDGFATRNEVSRLGFAKLSEYYNFKRASEEVALEVAEAYLDTVKFQQLVGYAQDNLAVHRKIFDRIEERTGGGVSQGVDLDQAIARVALAESNLVTEAANLHDVMTRFQRLVGSLPADSLAVPSVPSGQIPELRSTALELAYQRSPVINSAIENLRSSQEALDGTNSPMYPRLDLRYRNEVEHDTDGLNGRFDEEALELVLSYNLYRGGADSARKRQFYNLYNAAIEERKQACLNVRQEVMIGFNNVEALENQVVVLKRNMEAQNKTRAAYQDQFDIGQRSLLDLLDSQNEYFDTERAYISAVTDLVKAQAATLANMGLLLASLDVDGLNAEKIQALDLNFTRDEDDENAKDLCPREPTAAAKVDRDALFANLAGAQDPAVAAAALAGLAAGSTRYSKRGDMYVLEVKVQFEFNSSIIATSYDDEIARAAHVIRENPGVRVTVEGHTDSSGGEDYNQWLSERRANAVRDILLDQSDINAQQVVAIGHGESSPIADNATAAGRAENRRVEFVMDTAPAS